MRWLALVVVVVCGTRAAHASCKNAEAVEAAKAKADAANEKSFRKALAAAKLTAVTPQVVEWDDDTDVKDVHTVQKRTIDGKTLDVLLLGSTASSCDKLTAELAKNGDTVYMIERSKILAIKKIEICDCIAESYGCPVPGKLHSVGVVIPAGMKYGGEKVVKYSAQSVQTVLSPRHKEPCPPPRPRK